MDIKPALVVILLTTSLCDCSDLRMQQVIKFDLFSLYNATLSPFMTKISVGTPPQVLNVLVDTGSGLTWVDCSRHRANFFELTNSSSASVIYCSEGVPCSYNQSYKDGSTSYGYMVSDVIHFSTYLSNSSVSQLSTPIIFGCSLTSTLLTEIDGILGLDQTKNTIVSQLFEHKVSPKIVSHCLSTKGNGYLLLGEALEESFSYSPLNPSTTKYGVFLESVNVNDKRINAKAFEGKYGTIFDSGTTLTLLVAGLYDSIIDAVNVSSAVRIFPVPGQSGTCYDILSSDSFPQIMLNFANGASLLLMPQDYLQYANFLWCIEFVRDEEISILGDLVLREKVVVYDQPRQRMGWLTRNCSLPLNVSLNYNNFMTSGILRDAQLWSSAFLLATSLCVVVSSY